MFWQKLLSLLALFLIVFSGSSVFAESCPKMTGDWDMVFKSAYNDSDNNFGYMETSGIIRVINQDECLFYGEVEIPSNPGSGCPLTGVITSGKVVTMTSCDSILIGKIYGSNKRIKFTLSNVEKSGSDWQGTGSGIAIRQK